MVVQSPNEKARAFVTTRWTRVLQARGAGTEAELALSELCEAYYEPVLTFIRCATRDIEHTRDLTQDFFTRLLSQNHLAKIDPERGRFRSYLLAAVKNFLRDAHARDQAQNARDSARTTQSIYELSRKLSGAYTARS